MLAKKNTEMTTTIILCVGRRLYSAKLDVIPLHCNWSGLFSRAKRPSQSKRYPHILLETLRRFLYAESAGRFQRWLYADKLSQKFQQDYFSCAKKNPKPDGTSRICKTLLNITSMICPTVDGPFADRNHSLMICLPNLIRCVSVMFDLSCYWNLKLTLIDLCSSL